ncbi:MAG: SDR family oxidoreductase [Firmicutes bacterium]|nr:SDR family oxidoreductase [Alicyclobacillaceae bacterium]MCL6497996.1 SDR family oxidoreductase [Bacillota bacterium]
MAGVLKDKVAVVTGAAGSLGLTTARRFLAEGARVMLVDQDDAALGAAARDLPVSSVATMVADVSRAQDVQAYLEATVERWGPIDVLFSNAGNAGPIAAITDCPEEAFDRVWAVHVKGAFLNCKYGLPRMRDGGSIIITSSVAAFRGDPGAGAYITAKHAQIGLMRTVAKEAAPRRIRVNTIHPGPVHNRFQADIEAALSRVWGQDATAVFDQQIPLGRHADPEEVAAAVVYLASDASRYITGHTLVIDGGLSI